MPYSLLAQVFGHSAGKAQSSRGIRNSLFPWPLRSRQDCCAAQPNATVSAFPHPPKLGVRALRAEEIHADQGPPCFTSIQPHVTFRCWMPAKIGAGTLLHVVVLVCGQFSSRGTALPFPGALWMGDKIS